MKNYGLTFSLSAPQALEFTENNVFVASNIQQTTRTYEDITENCYSYNLVEYTKDEYLAQQQAAIANLQEELQAAKILLGVE